MSEYQRRPYDGSGRDTPFSERIGGPAGAGLALMVAAAAAPVAIAALGYAIGRRGR